MLPAKFLFSGSFLLIYDRRMNAKYSLFVYKSLILAYNIQTYIEIVYIKTQSRFI